MKLNFRKTAVFIGFLLCLTNGSFGSEFYSTNWLDTSTSAEITPRNMSFNVWVPDTNDVEGVLFWWHGDGYWPNDWDDNPHFIVEYLRKVATTLDFAIIHRKDTKNNTTMFPSISIHYPDETDEAWQRILQLAAEVSGHPELTAVPQMHTGFSGGGIECQGYPHIISERVIASASFHGVSSDYGHGGASTEELTSVAVDKVPIIFLAGRSDAAVTCPQIENTFGQQRASEFPAAFAAYPISHGLYWQSMEMGLYYMTETYRERLALGNPVFTNGIYYLPSLAVTNGWLGQSEDFDEFVRTGIGAGYSISKNAYAFPEITPYSTYTGEVENASWMPSEGAALAYRAYAANDDGSVYTDSSQEFRSGPLYLNGISAFASYTNGSTINFSIDPRTFSNVQGMDLYLNASNIAWGVVNTNGMWDFDDVELNVTNGVHALIVVATATNGNKTSCFRVITIDD